MKWSEGGGDGQGVGGQDEARLVSKFGSQLRLSGAWPQRQTAYTLTTTPMAQRCCSRFISYFYATTARSTLFLLCWMVYMDVLQQWIRGKWPSMGLPHRVRIGLCSSFSPQLLNNSLLLGVNMYDYQNTKFG